MAYLSSAASVAPQPVAIAPCLRVKPLDSNASIKDLNVSKESALRNALFYRVREMAKRQISTISAWAGLGYMGDIFGVSVSGNNIYSTSSPSLSLFMMRG